MIRNNNCTILFLFLLILLCVGCVGIREHYGARWTLTKREETKGGGQRLTYTDQHGRTRIVETISSDHVWQEVISRKGHVISDLGWYEDGSKRHEVLFEENRCIRDIEWYANGLKQREYIFKDGDCILNLVWYPSGQLSEKNVFRNGKYVAAPRWYPNGQLKYEAIFENGQAVKRTFYNEDGTVSSVEYGKGIPPIIEPFWKVATNKIYAFIFLADNAGEGHPMLILSNSSSCRILTPTIHIKSDKGSYYLGRIAISSNATSKVTLDPSRFTTNSLTIEAYMHSLTSAGPNARYPVIVTIQEKIKMETKSSNQASEVIAPQGGAQPQR